jgi:hypothetical protein
LPGRARPQLSDLSRETTEDDLWNLDEEAPVIEVRVPNPAPQPRPPGTREAVPEDPPAAVGPAAEPESGSKTVGRMHPRRERTVAAPEKDEIGELEDPAEREEEAEVTLTVIAEEPAEETPAAADTAAPPEPAPPAEAAAPTEAPAPRTRENKPRAASATEAAPKGLQRPRLNRREVVGIASFALVILIAAVWMLSRFFSQLSFREDVHALPDFPIEGERIAVEDAATFWREPVRSGENRDVARREVVWIPVLEITLDPDESPAGALRVIFRNSQGDPVGDPITRSFAAGRFEASGNATMNFPATDGFEKDGDFQAYRTGSGDPWVVELLEGPSADAAAGTFKKLSSIPILPLRR